VLFLRLAAYTFQINPDPSGPGATGIEKLLNYAGGYGLIFAGVGFLTSLAVAGGASMFQLDHHRGRAKIAAGVSLLVAFLIGIAAPLLNLSYTLG
jgi:hypothetical protein